MKKRMISPLLLLFLFAMMVGCANDESVTAPVPDPELCDNGIDDDGDGLTDCDDPDCVNDPICPCTSVVGWISNPANGHLYRLTSGPLSIDDARAEADALCGYLVSIADQNENEFVRDNFSGPAQALTYCWIGLSDEDTEGEWLWDSGEPYIPSNAQWIVGEPSGGAEDHVEMNTNPQGMPADNWGRWNDVGPTTIDKWGIIEREN